jgi:hypothetical protein
LQKLQGDGILAREDAIHRELRRLQTERANLVRAIAAGGELEDLMTALQKRDARRVMLERELATFQHIASGRRSRIRRAESCDI